MVQAGHGFPAPELIPVVAALDGRVGWSERLGKFVDRWVSRSERMVSEGAAVLNRVLTTMVVVIVCVGVWLFFGVIQELVSRGL